VGTLLEGLPRKGWKRVSCGKGTKGERYYDWYVSELNPPAVEGWSRKLLVRRGVSDPSDMRAFTCFCREGTPLQKLVQVAGCRWRVEQSFEETKGEIGLDHYEVRGYEGWYKHITLACCAHALLAVMKSRVNNDEYFQEAVIPDGSDSMRGFKRGRNIL
jgi:SRSO17 transposase